jgi:hypothetical protein
MVGIGSGAERLGPARDNPANVRYASSWSLRRDAKKVQAHAYQPLIPTIPDATLMMTEPVGVCGSSEPQISAGHLLLGRRR